MSFITTGIELLAKQLREYADSKDVEEGATRDRKALPLFDIGRAD